jgi:hypothetical protein
MPGVGTTDVEVLAGRFCCQDQPSSGLGGYVGHNAWESAIRVDHESRRAWVEIRAMEARRGGGGAQAAQEDHSRYQFETIRGNGIS